MPENIVIEPIPVGDYQLNTYLAACSETKEGVLIEPAGEEQCTVTPRHPLSVERLKKIRILLIFFYNRLKGRDR